ncbi:MAG: carboxyl transferase domain-containing protein, partial [Bermanella sp.]
MPVIHSKLNIHSAEFKENQANLQTQVDDLQDLIATIELGGGEKSQARHKSRGKLLVRDRIALLIDEGSPFLEVAQLAAHKVYSDNVPCAGVVAGIGKVNGVECMIVANDATVKGGSYYPLSVKKHLR